MTKRNDGFGWLFISVGFITFAAAIAILWDPSTPVPASTRAPSRAPTNTLIPTSTASPTRAPTPIVAYRPVTWMELVSFISDDHTNWNEYVPGHYVCLDFAIDLVENAGKQNIKAWIVTVEFYNDELGHAFAAFETTDRGIVFIEPQADVPFVTPVAGQFLIDAWQGRVFIGKISAIEYLQCDSDHSHYCDPFTP